MAILPSFISYPRGRLPPTQIPFRFDAAVLSRMRSEVTSLSNWANDKSTLSVSRPIEVVVLNCWVTETNETPWASNSSIISRPNQGPPGMGLTLYISRGCVVLGIERIELLIQSVIGRDPGVDRAADGFE